MSPGFGAVGRARGLGSTWCAAAAAWLGSACTTGLGLSTKQPEPWSPGPAGLPALQEAAAHAAATAAAAAAAAAKPPSYQQQQPPAAAAPAAPGVDAAGPAAPKKGAVAAATGAVRASPAALEHEQALAAQLSVAEAALEEYKSQPELRKQLRSVEKEVTKYVNQIAGTLAQVMAGHAGTGDGWAAR
jgi:hypothetical protein